MAGVELPSDLPWPPVPADDPVVDLGVIDSRAQRQAVLEQLQQNPPSRILIVCDARQTPDRGAIALITELAGAAGDTRIALAAPDHRSEEHTSELQSLMRNSYAVFCLK